MFEHTDSFSRALLSLHGLAIGDGLGEMMFSRMDQAYDLIAGDQLPAGPWWHTDDTEMAISVVEVLRTAGKIDRDALARNFLERFERSPDRGYGSGARRQLRMMLDGLGWREAARDAFGGEGSLGNGSAMRVPPVGAWFADDLDRVAAEARASAMVTHMHTEGVSGAIAGAVATAMAWRLRSDHSEAATEEFFKEVHNRAREGETRRGIAKAYELRHFTSPVSASRILGNGVGITCPDTIPFTIWAAAKYRANFREAIAATASVGGDIDTNCAIVGGIVAPAVGWSGIPADWLRSIESLPWAAPSSPA